ncbi:MAG: hypothetical protein K0U98_25115 [Deltaproteobacteria bacterium]|nr:hypothetical protein [Deltaproteobacteria bacterium]
MTTLRTALRQRRTLPLAFYLLAVGALFTDLAVSKALAQSPAQLNAAHGIGALDIRPSATLLLPYWEVELDGDESLLVRVRNTSSESTLAHVSLWTDMARPTLNFHIYLTGFDTVLLDLAQLFNQGLLPTTGPSVTDPGPYSLPNQEFPGCSFPLPSILPEALRGYIRALHTGQAAPAGFPNTGLCGASLPGDGRARGFLLINVVDACSSGFPDQLGFFVDGGSGIAINDNRLWGEYLWQDSANSLGLSDPLVAIEARSSVAGGFWDAQDHTFYARYLNQSAIDNREPLATTWALGYTRGDAEGEGPTELLCWRDSGLDDSFFFPCSQDPDQDAVSPYRLAQSRLVVFDQEENLVELPGEPFSPPNDPDFFAICPFATNRVNLSDVPMLFPEGWMYLDLNTSSGALSDPIKQSHVTVVNTRSGSTHGAHVATPLDNALAPVEDPFPEQN